MTSGSFTLNRERALELAKTLQLPEKRAYILKLVQWAVQSKATRIQMEASGGSVVFRHNGRPPTQEEFEKLKMGVVDFAHLSSGIFGALGLEPSRLVLSWGEVGFEFVSGEVLEQKVEGPWVQVQIKGVKKGLFERSGLVSSYLRKNWNRVSVTGALQRLILDSVGFGNIESALVRSFCGLCYVPIELNGKFINSLFEPVSGSLIPSWRDEKLVLKTKPTSLSVAVFLNFCFGEEPGQILCPTAPVPGTKTVKIRNQWFRFGEKDPIEVSGLRVRRELESVIWLGGLPTFRAQGFHRPMVGLSALNVLLIKDGVLVDEFTEKGSGLSGSAFFSADHLKVSADGFRLVRDDAFEEYQTYIREFALKNQVGRGDYDRLISS